MRHDKLCRIFRRETYELQFLIYEEETKWLRLKKSGEASVQLFACLPVLKIGPLRTPEDNFSNTANIAKSTALLGLAYVTGMIHTRSHFLFVAESIQLVSFSKAI